MTPSFELAVAERELPSGLTLVAAQNPGVPTFAAYLSLACDVRDETEDEVGLGYFVGECLDEGTLRRDGNAFADALDALGAYLECGGSGLLVQCPVDSADKAVRLLVEALRQPAFGAREVRRVREEILAELDAENDEPDSVAARRFRREVYGEHPFGRPVRGTREVVAGYRPADLRRFHRRWHVAEGAILAAVGPQSCEQTLDRLARAFRGFGGRRPERPRAASIASPTATRDLHLPMDREQVHVYLGHPGVTRTDPDYYALSVMDHVLGTGPGFTARIPRRLRDEQGLCYSVDASICSTARDDPGAFIAYIGCAAASRQPAIDGFLAEIRELQAEPPSAEEVQEVRDYLTGSHVLGLERNTNLARYLHRAKRYGLGYDFYRRYPSIIEAISPDDVQRVASEHLHPDRVVIVSAGAEG